MTSTDIAKTPLVYNGVPILVRDEKLSLTDMWKASDAPSGRAPSDWLDLASTGEFREAVEATFNAGKSGIITKKGKGGGTLAHWQIAFAYAKYLSPEFHMWCNTVVRERMEGRSVSLAGLPPELVEKIERSFGISCMLSHKVTEIEKAMTLATTALATIATTIQPAHPGFYVQGKSSGEIWAEAGLPKGIKNAARWLGNRLAEMGCQMDDCRTMRVGLRKVRQFDPDKAAMCLKNGLLHKAKVYASERMGQTKLKLVPMPIKNRPADNDLKVAMVEEAKLTFGDRAAEELARSL